MAAHGHTITWGAHIGKSTPGARGHWSQRLRRWLTGRSAGGAEAVPVSFHGVWDSRREQFQPAAAESALEHAAGRGGQFWFITLHSAAL